MYEMLQSYCWFLVSVPGALLVFLLFVQGGSSLVWKLGGNESQRYVLLLAIGRRRVLPLAALACFGVALPAAFPLFCSVVVGGAYWLWGGVLLAFAVQAVFYELRVRWPGVKASCIFSVFLFLGSVLAPLLTGMALGTFFSGGEFLVDKATHESLWLHPLHGLEAALSPWNLCLGAVLVFLSRLLACLYLLGNLSGGDLRVSVRRHLLYEAGPFLLFFLLYMWHWLTQDAVAVTDGGMAYMESCKYLDNLLGMPAVGCTLLAGVALVLAGIVRPLLTVKHHGFLYVLTVLAMLLCAGWNNTAYFPSAVNLQSSLTIHNSCACESALRLAAYVSTPLILACIVWAWRMHSRQSKQDKD